MQETDVHVVGDVHGKYLRTDRDATRRNNLDELPSAPRVVLDPDVVQELDISQILESDNTSANIDEAQEARVEDPLWRIRAVASCSRRVVRGVVHTRREQVGDGG